MKSHVSSLLEIAAAILRDGAAKCAAKGHERDFETLKSRSEHEGLSFLTITLPTFCRDFDRSLAIGRIEPTFFRSFKKKGRAPALLQGFLALVFDTNSGRILDEPNIGAIEAVRQATNVFKKVEIACEPFRVRKALSNFQQCELDFEKALDPSDVDFFVNVSDHLWPLSIGRLVSKSTFEMKPKHGPGSTGERISGNQKYVHLKWHDRLEPYFPILINCLPNEGCYGTRDFERVSVVLEDREQPVRVTPVPKTLKAPRIIAIEPVCMQYTQQAIASELVSSLESSRVVGGQINFRSQEINQELAMISSRSGKFATLDMSDASDRVPYSLAIRMFDFAPELQAAISACRSKKAKMPDGTIIPLSKFASMGSALCFPVEAMYFYTICVAARLKKHDLPVTPLNIIRMCKDTYVYGDDIIVPTDDAAAVTDHLQRYYCKVNTDKSFYTGKFRESCGVDAYDGEQVTPVYLRRLRPSHRREIKEIISWVKTSNLFYKKGYWSTADLLYKQIRRVIGALPITHPRSPGLGLESFQHMATSVPRAGVKSRFNKDLQRFEIKCWCACPVYQKDKLNGIPALMKFFLNPTGDPLDLRKDRNHLHQTARYGAVTLKRRWQSRDY